MDYHPHMDFFVYLADKRRISVIYKRSEAIGFLIPEHFHIPLSMDKYYSLHIFFFNIVAKIPLSASNKQPDFLQCRRHTKFRSIFRLILPDLSTNCSNFCNIVPQYLYANLILPREVNLATRVLMTGEISEVSPYDFNTKYISVTPKHV